MAPRRPRLYMTSHSCYYGRAIGVLEERSSNAHFQFQRETAAFVAPAPESGALILVLSPLSLFYPASGSLAVLRGPTPTLAIPLPS
jgi:hypothetical protein